MTNATTRFGIIGTGRITRRLVADLQSTENVAVTAIASRDGERARWYADQYGIENAVAGYESLLARDDVDAVYISLPPSMHAEWTIAAAEHGKNILCEKPLAMNLDQAQQVDAACEKHQVRWLDATGWLHHGRTDAFNVWLAEQKFGEIGHISAAVSFFEPFQSCDHRLNRSLGGGCRMDLAWYAGGLIVFASDNLGPMAVQASAVMRGDVPIRVTAMLTIGAGVSATLSCGYDTATRKWFEIAGSKSSLICDDFTRPWNERPTRCWIHDSTGSVESHTYEGNQERQMIQRFIGNDDLAPLQRQALRTQALLDAIEISINQDGQRVDVPVV